MEFIKLNINSTKPFYTDKLGNIYNKDYKKLKGSKINGCHFLTYVLNGKEGISCKESIARIIYQTYFPKESLSGYNIFKKDLFIENPYQIDNLKKVLKNEMPNENKLPEIQNNKKEPIKRKFFEKLPQDKLSILIALAKNKNIKNSVLAKLFSVGPDTILRHRNYIKKIKIKI